MKLNKLFLAGAVAVACSSAMAENINSSGITLNNGSATFGISHSGAGAFTDTISFTGGPAFANITASLISIAFMAGTQDINFTSASLNGNAFTFGSNGLLEFGQLSATNVAGPFVLTVMGTALGNSASERASYSGTINLSPIPEPETYALMLAGLAAVGFVAARRKRNG